MPKDRCPDHAEITCTWAGKMLDVCRYHGVVLSRLGMAIGSPIDVRPIPVIATPRPCSQPDNLAQLDKDEIDRQLAAAVMEAQEDQK